MRRLLPFLLLLAVGAWHLHGLWLQRAPADHHAALTILNEGAPDREERRRCLGVLVGSAEAAIPREGPRAALLAGAAAIALGDRETYNRVLRAAGPAVAMLAGHAPPWPASRPEAEALAREASCGEHWLRRLMLGYWLRAAGETEAAAAELAQAAASASWSGSSLGGQLAQR